ncbi:MAG: potassium-transporting ATPase subunit KdpA [Acidimicrobiales bacterium]
MRAADWLQAAALLVTLGVLCPLLGKYIAAVYSEERTAPGDRFFGPVERLVYRVCGIDPDREQRWNVYAVSMLMFSAASVLVVYLLERLQGSLPLNPTGMAGVSPGIAWNTAVSFVTNTNWQSYSGESTMSHLTQMAALGVQNFVSAAVGLAVAIALIRGLVRQRRGTIGNFWTDITRAVTRILLPICVVGALVFVGAGVVQNLSGGTTARTLDGATQTIPGGPVASQEIIKQLGTNGGGFYNGNSTHPFESPTGLTNFLQIVLLLLIPFALAFAFGRMANDRKQGYVVAATMFVLLFGLAANNVYQETHGNPRLTSVGATQTATADNPGGNLEGKEVRFGSASCGEFSAATTNTSTGAVDCQHDSMTPLGGGGALFGMMLGEISPGGVGSGLYGMLIFVLTAVFLAGLMVGRTPEYLGKRIQATEIKLVVLYVLFVPLVVLGFGAVSVVIGSGLEGQLNTGAHGLSEVLYAFTSAGNNNGSAFGGLTATNDWYTTTLAISMLIGRFFLMVPALAIAGSLVRKRRVPVTSGTFPTNTPLFAGLLTATALIVVGLTYFPLLALGPIVERLAL